MKIHRDAVRLPAVAVFLVVLPLGIAGHAQDPPPTLESDIRIISTVQTVVAPVLVTDKAGNIIDGLRPDQFHLLDNGKEQNISVDLSFQPVSLVIAIEASDRVDAILTQIKKMGSLTQVVTGEQGEAAVIAFDSRVRVMQDFTNDQDKLRVAINKIGAGNSQSRMIDAVERGSFMLRSRPRNNRKIILLVSETRDQGSEARLRETLINAQLSNVLVYTVDITQVAVRLSEKAQPPRPDPIAPTMRTLPMGQPSTPTSSAQNFGVGNQAQFVPMLKEIYLGAKLIFVDQPTKVLSKGTGGNEFFFVKSKGLEDAVQRIGQEIHSQYIISYTPNNKDESGFHEIEVSTNRPELIARTRPGYFIAGGAK